VQLAAAVLLLELAYTDTNSPSRNANTLKPRSAGMSLLNLRQSPIWAPSRGGSGANRSTTSSSPGVFRKSWTWVSGRCSPRSCGEWC